MVITVSIGMVPGARLGPYEILAPVGAGGTGEVWKARDTRLDRIVAIKRLKTQHGTRFEQEARAIAALNHPHICQIFDVGPDYLVLEFITGTPLRGPLPAGKALSLALQIADALEAAHKRGILHRDLKPANIMVTEAGAKLLDFGLAKLTAEPDPDLTRTMDGLVVGTAAYMSPEQAQGQTVDARSDVFSFGAVLYEMLSGRRAFSGSSILETLNAVVKGEALPLDCAGSAVVDCCLAKNPDRRFQSVPELKEALRAALAQVSGSPAAAQAVAQVGASIAVLPFANISGDPEQEYFSDGLTEEIINALVRIPGLRVIARTSAFAFKGRNTDVRRIAETLGVSNVLEGSVRRSGKRIRVIAELITAADGSHLWSERFDRELADVFEMQDEISESIARTLQAKLTPESAPRPRYVPKLAAHEALLRAWYFNWKLTPESAGRARQFFDEAIALDPQFALAHSAYAEHLFFLAHVGAGPAHELMPAMRAEARKALELDPSLSEAHAALGLIAATYDHDWQEAERRYTRAMLHDVSPWTRALYGFYYLLPAGRAEEAVKQAELALQDDPLHLVIRATLTNSLIGAGRYAEAEQQIQQSLALEPNYFPTFHSAAGLCAIQGRFAEALAYAEKAYALNPRTFYSISALAGLLARTGERARAEELMQLVRTGRAWLVNTAFMYFGFFSGDMEQAADSAEKALEDGVPSICAALSLAKELHATPRWPRLARMMNLPVPR
jgi:TolB-like protein/tRNA A-37 threonylcarbamoyl transferase component Bud32/Tfp pilus assembly protein PilF